MADDPPAGQCSFDKDYGNRVLLALSDTVGRVSSDKRTGAAHIKPFEVALALVTLAGRMVGYAEHEHGSWPDDAVETVRASLAEERVRTRDLLSREAALIAMPVLGEA